VETIQSKSYPYHLVLGVVGSDVHCIANQLLEKDLNWHDFQVTNLGVALSPTEVLDSVRKLANPVLLLGTLNGDFEPTISTIVLVRESFGIKIPIVVGGNFALGELGRDRSLDLLAAGADLVIKNSISIEDVVFQIRGFLETCKANSYSG
jgi:methylmalonyl-CoA mutase cobalamin-binding subunit